MKRPLIPIACLLFGAFSCATNPFPLKASHADTHGSAVEEWAPHRGVGEWWYVTCILEDGEDNPYLCQFTIFHGVVNGVLEGYALHLAMTDVKGEKRYFFETSSVPNAEIYGNEAEIAFNESVIRLQTDGGEAAAVTIEGKAEDFSLSLSARLAKPPAWHGENGIIVMGHEDKERERSFYYSFTDMETEGTLTLGKKSVPVRGSSWLDRQWGTFTESAWDWFSLRLFDGTQIMLFAFPRTGYTTGTRIALDGSSSPISGFHYEKLDLMRHAQKDLIYILGWRVTLAGGEEYMIVPLAADQGNPARRTPPYWEGICDVLSASGERLGYCVVETTAGAQ